MVTVDYYYKCPYCKQLTKYTTSSKKKVPNLLLCPFCGRNIMRKK